MFQQWSKFKEIIHNKLKDWSLLSLFYVLREGQYMHHTKDNIGI